MEEAALLNLWKAYDKKLETSLAFNRKNAEDITKIKIRSLLGSMRPLKILAILTGLLWVGSIDVLIISTYQVATPFFLISAGIQVLLTKMAIGVYLYQLILIHQTDITAPILETQHKLAKLKTSTLWVTRLLFLQLPVWTTFYWNRSMLENGHAILYLIQFLITLSMTYLVVWLFLNIRYENREKKWFRLILGGAEWDPVMKSFDLLNQTEELKQ
jgi:hypothetical protein